MTDVPQTRVRAGGIILCGGRSSRMGHPKAWLAWGEETLLVHTTRILAQAVGPIVIVAGPDQELPLIDLPEPPLVTRDPVAYLGPLAGIAQGLEALPVEVEAAYVSSCDVPLLRPQWVRFLIDCLRGVDIVLPHAQDRLHPLSGVYRRSVAATARRLIAAGRRRPIDLLDEHPWVGVSADQLRQVDPDLDSLRNANTPAEYAELLARWEESKRGMDRGEPSDGPPPGNRSPTAARPAPNA